MLNWLRRALTKQVIIPTEEEKTRALRLEEIPPSQRLIMVIALTILTIVLLTALEIVHMAFLGVWNSEIFSAITSLAGLVVGALIGSKT